jgi:hypothetical protein
MEQEKYCHDQSFFTPLERSKKNINKFCIAICESTGRRCHNIAKNSVKWAPMVLEVDGCCKLCNMHTKSAIKKLSIIQLNVSKYVFNNLIKKYDINLYSQMCYEQKAGNLKVISYSFQEPLSHIVKNIKNNIRIR